MIRSWFQEVLNDEEDVPIPDFRADLTSYERTKRFDWVPDYSGIPAIKALEGTRPTANDGGGSGGGGGGDRTNTNPPTNDANARASNNHRDPRYTGNTPFANNVRTRSITDAIAAAGRPPPQVTREGRTMQTCLSWHVKGSCSRNCGRKADHGRNTPEEADTLYEWCQPAFA